MKIHFHKYQGTGNDFVIIDNRNWSLTAPTVEKVRLLCDRRFGIGADGLMLFNPHPGYDFEMKYYNSDGREGSMCGNGGRCMIRFAHDRGMKKNKFHFLAVDGEHEAEIEDDGTVSLKMGDVTNVEELGGDFILDTGSPHYVKLVSDVMDLDVVGKGMEIRYSPDFSAKGINVNFVERIKPDELIVRTYERGVEDETLSCGTGITASALVFCHNDFGFNFVKVKAKGGNLTVRYDREGEGTYRNIWLSGPAEKVFEGDVELAP